MVSSMASLVVPFGIVMFAGEGTYSFFLVRCKEVVSDRGSFLCGTLGQLRKTRPSCHHCHQQRRRTRMSQVFLRRCIQSPRIVQHHRRWLAQQTLPRSTPDTSQESTDGTEATDSTPQSVTSPIESSPQLTHVTNKKGGPRVDAFLASLHTAGSVPSLEDLERGRPREYAHPESPLYAKEYNGLLEHLDRSFTKEQLRRFNEQYRLDPQFWRTGMRKVHYARAIVENAWGWPSLREIERAKRERTEVVTESKHIFHISTYLDAQASL